MSITASWDNAEKTIVRLDFHDRWTIHDLATARQQLMRMAQDTDCGVGLIIDLTDGPVLPDKMIAHAAQVADLRSGQLDEVCYFVVLGSTPLGKALFRSFCKVSRPNKLVGKVAFVDSLNEARRILAQHCNAYT